MTDVGDRQQAAATNGRAAAARKAKAAAATTPPRASRSSRAWRPSAAGPGMYIGSTDSAASTTSCGRSSTTRSTRRWPATRRRSSSRSTTDGKVTVEDDGRGVPVGRHSTGKDALEVVHTVLHAGGKFGGGGYKVSGGLHGVGVSRRQRAVVVAARRDRARRRRLVARSTSAASRRRRSRRSARRARGVAPRRSFQRRRRRCSRRIEYSFDTIAQRLRESAYLTKGVWITLRDERIDRERSFYFEGGLVSFVRHLNRNKEDAPPPPDLLRAQGRHDDHRGRAPVQRLVHGERPRLREQHQHRRRRHPHHRLPRAR